MKRQVGVFAGTVLLLCASAAWAQSDNDSSSSSSNSSSSSGPSSSSSSPGLFTTWTQNDSGQSGGASGDTQSGGATGDTQNGSSDSTQSGSSGPQDTFSNPEKLPPLNLFREVTAHTGMSWTFTTGTLFQDEKQKGSGSNFETLTQFASGLSMAQARPTISWVASYSAGLSATTGATTTTYTNLNQSAVAEVRWRLGRLWALKVNDNYTYSDNPFQTFLTYIGNPTPNNPNPVSYYSFAVVAQNQGRATLTRRLTAHDTLIFGGGETLQRYYRGQVYVLWNNYTYSASSFYQHAFSPRLSAGGGYQFVAIDYGHGQSRSGVGTFEAFVSYDFTPTIEASVWVGPQRNNNKSIICSFFFGNNCFAYATVHTSKFSLAEGGTFKWDRSQRDSFGMEFSHSVNNGGLNVGVASIKQVTMTYNRGLNRDWSMGAGVLFSDNNSVSAYNPNQYFKSLSGTIGVSRRVFSDAWRFNGYYVIAHQKQNFTGLPSVVTSNGLGLSLRYVWDFGFGR